MGDALVDSNDGGFAANANAALEQDSDTTAAPQEFSTVATTSHKAQATTSVDGVARTFCRVRASVGLSGEASVGARDGPQTPPRSPSPELRPEAEPAPPPALRPEAEPAPPPALLPEAEPTPPPAESKAASFRDEEALARLVGPPISDSLLQELLNMSAEERMRLAEDLLRSLDPEDLRALLQKMRRFPWEVDCEAQTDHSGEIGTQHANGQGGNEEALDGSSNQLTTAGKEEAKPARPKTLFAPEKRALNQFLKGREDMKAKPQGLNVTRHTIAKIYEDKVMADEADDLDMRKRDGFPTFLYDYMLKEFGIKSLAMQNLAKLVKSVVAYANPESEQYDERVHVFGKLSGILEPFDFRTIEGDFICDFILALFVDPSSIDENMMKANPYFDISHATQLLEKQFQDNNMPMPETAQDAFIAAGQKSGKFDDDGVALVHIDHLLEMVHEEYVRAVQAREEELIAVFKYYDKDDDGNLGLAEFTHIVHEVDNGHACANAGLRSTYGAPDERDVREIAGMYTYAVEADEDDADMISPEAFIDVCYINNLGIGVHPQRRTEMVKAKASAKGHSHS